MLKNKTINLGAVKKVAKVLGELNYQVAYIGGAIVSIYADDPAADDARPTKDIDIMLHIASFAELTALQENLSLRRIYPDPQAKIACRFRFEDVVIDIMSTIQIGWAPSDPWFEPGFRNLITFNVDQEIPIRIFPVAYFLATKFSAFHDRGNDPRTSADFEDIVYVLDNNVNIVNEIMQSPDDVRNYLKGELREFLKEEMNENISCHLSPFSSDERLAMLREKIYRIVES